MKPSKRFRNIGKRGTSSSGSSGKKGGSPAKAGAFRPMPGRPLRTASDVCSCPPLIPGWPEATVDVVTIDVSNFWQTVSRPFVFRVVSVGDGSADMTREEADTIEAGYFVFAVRPGREDADMKALSDVLREQGGPVLGELVDLTGEGKMLVQIAAVLLDADIVKR